MRKRWDRQLWGVLFFSAADDDPMMIGDQWDSSSTACREHSPTRAMLFTTRASARAWCNAQNARWAARPDNCSNWRVRPVRVRERVDVLE